MSDKIVMRQILPADVQDILEISVYDGVRASTVTEAVEMLTKIEKNYIDGDSIHWGIVDKQTSIMVGTCGYYRGFANNTGELGCILLPVYRGAGYMSGAFKLVIDFGLNIMRLDKIIAITGIDNIKTKNLLERLQFVLISISGQRTLSYEYRLQE